MRITGGKYQGRKIKTLKENELRPTSSLVREALFNILNHNNHFCTKDIFSEKNTFLEIFCGSGIITLEFLSRGIKKAILLDYNPKLKDLFNYNAKILSHNEHTEFILRDITKNSSLSNNNIKADCCFLDPPYKKNLISYALNNLITHNYLNNKALIIIESDKRNEFNYDTEHYSLLLEKLYGKSKLTFLQYNNNV